MLSNELLFKQISLPGSTHHDSGVRPLSSLASIYTFRIPRRMRMSASLSLKLSRSHFLTNSIDYQMQLVWLEQWNRQVLSPRIRYFIRMSVVRLLLENNMFFMRMICIASRLFQVAERGQATAAAARSAIIRVVQKFAIGQTDVLRLYLPRVQHARQMKNSVPSLKWNQPT